MNPRAWLVSGMILLGCGSEKDDRDTGGGPAGSGAETCSFEDTNAPSTPGAPLAGIRLTGAASRFAELETEVRGRLSLALPREIVLELKDSRASGGAEHRDFRYLAAGVPLCGKMTHVHVVGDKVIYRDELPVGSLDRQAWRDLSSLRFDDPTAVVRRAATELGVAADRARLTSAERCWLVEGGAPVPAVEVDALLGGRPYRIVGNVKGLSKVSPVWFDATGEAQVFKKNVVDGELVTVELTDLVDETARLESRRFKTVVAAAATAAEFADRKYVVDPADERFGEIAMFTNVERMASWFSSPEHEYTLGCVPIDVEPHAVFKSPYSEETTVNNGVYIPPEGTGTGYPLIRMGDGDGSVLRNLVTDFDTVAHELGHHILYRRLKEQKGETAVLHEALADYFVFAATGDACLGESVCPAGSGVCAVEAQCLRSAANDLSFDSPELPPDTHRRSQFISGYLWDMGKSLGHDLVGKTLLKSIDYMGTAPTYADFVKALMDADLELTAGANSCAYLDGAKARGMTEIVADLTCDAK